MTISSTRGLTTVFLIFHSVVLCFIQPSIHIMCSLSPLPDVPKESSRHTSHHYQCTNDSTGNGSRVGGSFCNGRGSASKSAEGLRVDAQRLCTLRTTLTGDLTFLALRTNGTCRWVGRTGYTAVLSLEFMVGSIYRVNKLAHDSGNIPNAATYCRTETIRNITRQKVRTVDIAVYAGLSQNVD